MDQKTIIIHRAGFGTFLRGAIFGAAIALLFAPRAGKETRDMLADKGEKIRTKASEIVQETRSRAEDAISDVRNKLDEKLEGAKEGILKDSSEAQKELKRKLEITEEINNPYNSL